MTSENIQNHIPAINEETHAKEPRENSIGSSSKDQQYQDLFMRKASVSSKQKTVSNMTGSVYDFWRNKKRAVRSDPSSNNGTKKIKKDNDPPKAPDELEPGNRNKVTPNNVKATLSLFRTVCKSLKEEKQTKDGIKCLRVDFQATKILRDNLRHIEIDKPMIGSIPGMEVNETFKYRMELAIVGLHRPSENGIDYVEQLGRRLATSVVASGGYKNDMRDDENVVYVGQGGRRGEEDQVLERGNLALKNSINEGNPVRMIRKTDVDGMYTYDGLYLVTKYWSELLGVKKKLVYKFLLTRIPNQPKLVHRTRK